MSTIKKLIQVYNESVRSARDGMRWGMGMLYRETIQAVTLDTVHLEMVDARTGKILLSSDLGSSQR